MLFAHASPALSTTEKLIQLSTDFLTLYEQIADDPQSVKQQLNARQLQDYDNLHDQAQHHYILAQLASALDISHDIIRHSRDGQSVIDSSNQPWLFHKLKLAELDGLNRQGLGASGRKAAQTALKWAQQNQHLQLEVEALITLGELNISTAEYNQAIEQLQNAYQKAPDSGKGILKANVAGHLAGIYITRGEYEIAIPYLTESLKHSRKHNKVINISIDLFELGRANLIVGNIELGKKQLLESIDISRELRDIQGIAYPTNELAYYELSQGHVAVAEKLANQAHQLFVEADNKLMLFDSFLLFADIYTHKKSHDEAAAAIESAAELLDPERMPYEALRLKHYRANLTAARGDYQNAYTSLSETIYEKATIDAKQSAEKLHQLRSRYELEAKDSENRILTQTNEIQDMEIKRRSEQIMYLTILTAVSLLFVLLLTFFALKYKKQSQLLHDLANYDELTGLRNRSNTLYTIKKIFANHQSHKMISLVMIDLDHFKKINDLFGHALGDKVLRLFGEHCRKHLISQGDIMGRIGGEEFLVCLPGRNCDDTLAVMEALRVITTHMPDHIAAPNLKVSFSAGIACASNSKQSFNELLKKADDAMYQAKTNGRNQIIIHQDSERS